METLLFPAGTKVSLKSYFHIDLEGNLVEKTYLLCHAVIFGELMVEIPNYPTQQKFANALAKVYQWIIKRTNTAHLTEPISTDLKDYL